MNLSITLEELSSLDTIPEWEPPRRNILPDELEEEPLDNELGRYEELNFDD